MTVKRLIERILGGDDTGFFWIESSCHGWCRGDRNEICRRVACSWGRSRSALYRSKLQAEDLAKEIGGMQFKQI